MKNIKIKLRSKKDKQAKSTFSDKMKSAALMKNYMDRMNESVENKALTESINVYVILLEETTGRNEALPFQFDFFEEITVKKLIEMIPLYAKDPVLGKMSYQLACFDNSSLLEKFVLLQCCFLPSKQFQFLVAIPIENDYTKAIKLAQPIVKSLKSTSNNTFIPLNKKLKEEYNRKDLPLLRDESLRSVDSYSMPTPISVADILLVFLIMLFLLVTCL